MIGRSLLHSAGIGVADTNHQSYPFIFDAGGGLGDYDMVMPAQPVPHSKRIRIAIVVHADAVFERWELALIERIAKHPVIDLCALYTVAPASPEKRNAALFRAVHAAERRLFAPRTGSTLDDLVRLHPDLPLRPLPATRAETSDIDIAISHAFDTDFGQLSALFAECWRYEFDRIGSAGRENFGFHPCRDGQPLTLLTVTGARMGMAEQVICHCSTSTKPFGTFNRDYATGLLPSLIERELVRRHHGQPSPPAAMPPCQPAFTIGDTLHYVGRSATRMAARMGEWVLRHAGAEPGNWSMLTGKGTGLDGSVGELRELQQPRGQFRADPFLFRHGDDTWVFFETAHHTDRLGRIEAGRIEGDRVVDIRPIELGKVHLSYPFIFRHDDQIFMIPETHQRNRVEVWRCTGFPDRWELHSTALDGLSPADTVLTHWQGKCWLFTNLAAGAFADHCAELHLFRVDGPDLRQVEPHALNPVVIGTGAARNGGRPFVHGGRLIRPAQITSHGTYGYGLTFCEITRLSLSHYEEREVRRVEPDGNSQTSGCHHYDQTGEMFVIDARRRHRSRLLGSGPIAVRAT